MDPMERWDLTRFERAVVVTTAVVIGTATLVGTAIPYYGWQVLAVDQGHATLVAAATDRAHAERIAQLLDRHGLVDVPIGDLEQTG